MQTSREHGVLDVDAEQRWHLDEQLRRRDARPHASTGGGHDAVAARERPDLMRVEHGGALASQRPYNWENRGETAYGARGDGDRVGRHTERACLLGELRRAGRGGV